MSDLYSNSYPYLYQGKVLAIDTSLTGRCKVLIPSIHGAKSEDMTDETFENTMTTILPWAMPIVLAPVSKSRKVVNIPDVGDLVWVLFRGGDKNFPMYFGGTYDISDSADGEGDVVASQHRVVIYSEGEDEIAYNRGTGGVSLIKSIHLKVGDTRIFMTDNDLSIVYKNKENIKVVDDKIVISKGNKDIEVTDQRVTIHGDLYVTGTINTDNLIEF